MISQQQSDLDAEVNLPDTLRRTGSCISNLGQTVLEIEHQLMEADGVSSATLREANGLQALDFLKQATDDIAALLVRLAEAIPPSAAAHRADLIDPMKLQELRDAIGCGETHPRSGGTSPTRKEIELF